MDYRVYLLFLVGIVGASQWFASSQTASETTSPYVTQRDALMPERSAAERTVERMTTLEAAGGVDGTWPARSAEALPCDSLSFAGGGPVCHTTAPEIRVERGLSGALRVSAVRRTPRGTHVVARARVRGMAQDELLVETLP